MTEKRLIYVHFLCPIPLLKEFDQKIEGKYTTRTQALLDFIRSFCKKEAE